jgi:SAM-dependent methyltransferase
MYLAGLARNCSRQVRRQKWFELFSPRGAGLYARFAVPLREPLYRNVPTRWPSSRRRRCSMSELAPAPWPSTSRDAAGPARLSASTWRPRCSPPAQQRARDAGVAERVDFRVADAAALPLADASVDVAVSILSLHHWRDVPAILRELHRVVRPGGRVLIDDPRFSYSPRQFDAFVALTPFAAEDSAYGTLAAGPLPIAPFARFELARG